VVVRVSAEARDAWRLAESRLIVMLTLCSDELLPNQARELILSLGSGPRGRRFKSFRPDHFFPINVRFFSVLPLPNVLIGRC